jgi:hypothetical protein
MLGGKHASIRNAFPRYADEISTADVNGHRIERIQLASA